MSAQGSTIYEVRAKTRCSLCSGEGRLNESESQCPACEGAGVTVRWLPLQEALAASLLPPAKI